MRFLSFAFEELLDVSHADDSTSHRLDDSSEWFHIVAFLDIWQFQQVYTDDELVCVAYVCPVTFRLRCICLCSCERRTIWTLGLAKTILREIVWNYWNSTKNESRNSAALGPWRSNGVTAECEKGKSPVTRSCCNLIKPLIFGEMVRVPPTTGSKFKEAEPIGLVPMTVNSPGIWIQIERDVMTNALDQTLLCLSEVEVQGVSRLTQGFALILHLIKQAITVWVNKGMKQFTRGRRWDEINRDWLWIF